MSTGVQTPSARSRRTSSRPSRRGSITSHTMTSYGDSRAACSPSTPSSEVSTAKPSRPSPRAMASASSGSSSTTSTRIGPAPRRLLRTLTATQHDDGDVVVVRTLGSGDLHHVVEDLLRGPTTGVRRGFEQSLHSLVDVLAAPLDQSVGDGDERGAWTQVDRRDLTPEAAHTERRASCCF